MAEEVRSMSISLSMKDMGVDRTISDIRRSFRTLRDDVKLVNKDFQYGEKSLDSYNNRVEELSSAAKIAEKNVEELSNQYHEAGKNQGYSSKEALRLRQEWSKQKNELNFLQRDLEGATADLKAFQKQQMIANSGWTKAGNGISSFSSGLQSLSGKLSNTGRAFTNSITKPAMIATAALGGLTAKLGFDRLVGLDSAQAKLEGLGYSTKEVGKISDQVTNAIKGGMTTMAEGTDVAAGALASGVKEGKELEHYIKLVGDAAVGANRPVSDMAMIFNRVQGQGKLMTEELNMVEEGMPGFSKAMAKHLGVSYEAFRTMVTDGEVTSKDFLTVMDDFAGGMAGAYSKSFKGMVANTKAYIGMIGESLLSGVFEQSKDSLREFEKLLQSPSVQKWAQETGVKLGNALSSLSNAIGGIVSWFNSLDKTTQKSIASIMKWSTLILIGIGPVLSIFAKLTGIMAGVFGPFGRLLGFMGKLSAESKIAGSLLGGFTNLMPKLGAVLGVVTGPIGLITIGIIALGTALVIAYKKSETFRNIVNGAFSAVVTGLTALWNGVKTLLTPVVNAFKQFGGELKKTFSTFWAQNGPQFMQALNNIKTGFVALWNVSKPVINALGTGFSKAFAVIKTVVSVSMPVITQIFKLGWTLIQSIIVSVWNNIKGVIKGALNVIMGVIKVFSGLFTGNFRLMLSGVKQIFVGAFQFLWNLVQLWFVGKIFGVFKLGFGLIKGLVTRSLGGIKSVFTWSLGGIWSIVKSIFTKIWSFTKYIFTNIWKFTKSIWSNIKLAVTNPVGFISKVVPRTFRIMSSVIKIIFNGLKKSITVIFSTMRTVVVNIAKALSNLLRGNFSGMRKNLQNITSALKNAVIKLWRILKDTVVNVAKALWNGVKGIFGNLFKSVKSITQNLKDAVIARWKSIKTSVTDLASRAKDGVVNGFKAMYDKGKSWIDKLKQFLSDSVSGFKAVAKKVGNGVANGAIGGLNAMIDGINSLSNKIMSKKLIKKKIPKLSTGTGIQTDGNGLLKRSTKAIVNDKGPGNGRGPNGHKELIYRRSGKVERPIGNNKKVSLKRGDGVINGAQSQSMLPRFSIGSIKDEFLEGAGRVKDTGVEGYHKAKDKGSELIDNGKDLAGNAKKKFDKTIGDVMDYVKNPMKLVDKTLKMFGVDFSGIEGAYGGMMNFSYKGLKNGVKDLVSGWFSELEGGDGDSSWVFKHDLLQSFGRYTGGLMFNGGRHYGLDFGMPTGTKIKAFTDGTVTQAGAVSGGGGNQVTLKEPGGQWYQWYMHMSKILTKKGAKVKAGDALGLSGNTGNSTTPHLHIQRMKGGVGNHLAVDPMSWLKSLKGGGSKAASKWRNDIVKAGSAMKTKLSGGDVNDIIKLIQTESNGNPKVTQNGYTDVNSGGNEARGLLQYTPGTFAGYKAKGSGNILNGFHQLKAFFNNSNWRKDLSSWKSRMARGSTGWGPSGSRRFATGGIIKSNGLYNLAEEGHEEIVIPTDPRRSTDAMKLINYAANKVQGRASGNKRPNQMKSGSHATTSNDNSEILNALMQMVAGQQEQMKKQDKQINILTEIAMKAGFNESDVSNAQGKRAAMLAWNMGGAIT
ncbi:peptidoglycan DD-metalloendopeptidase family protein [Mammaliicoccus vitulinus]|uniref:peptidoglycan DD-metalloendopeptidase family protein n=1 Tax=Mammaliicoccus vitulinus TaxID=71237 RepID=UPI0018674565|nr:peptidoglycan DD-metalloendopeptidase family protein [Mammaliicoccus vitulinus]